MARRRKIPRWAGARLRLALDRDGLMKAQARALLEAAAGRDAQRHVPDGLGAVGIRRGARLWSRQQREWLAGRRKLVPLSIRYGAMLEVPALAETLDLLLPKVDFLSIGTNDLTQFLFAADRANPKLAERYDWLSARRSCASCAG